MAEKKEATIPLELEAQIKEILTNSSADIQATIRENLKQNIIDHLSWSLRDVLTAQAKEFVETEMQEDIKTLLVEAKPIILTELRAAMVTVAAGMAQHLVVKATANLDSYSGRKVIEGLFG